jgi:hypothetical protein
MPPLPSWHFKDQDDDRTRASVAALVAAKITLIQPVSPTSSRPTAIHSDDGAQPTVSSLASGLLEIPIGPALAIRVSFNGGITRMLAALDARKAL